EKLADVSDRLAGNPNVGTIEVPLPAEPERATFIAATTGSRSIAEFSDFGAAELAKLTAGISLIDVNVLIQSARGGEKRLDRGVFRALKKRLPQTQRRGPAAVTEPACTRGRG